MYTTTWFIRNATGDTLSYTADLPAGTYTVETIYAKSNDAGINDVTLGGVSAGSFDGYNGSTTYNHRLTTTGVVIASAGIKALVVTSNGKNASSTNYRLGLCGFHIWRTA